MHHSLETHLIDESQSHLETSSRLLALVKLLASMPVDADTIKALSRAFNIHGYSLGQPINHNSTAEANGDSVRAEHPDDRLYLICGGRVRLLCQHPDRPREVSVQVLEAGETFGADSHWGADPLPYRAIAASEAQVADIARSQLASWLVAIPALETILHQQARQRERLIFFKMIALRTPGAALPSDHLQQFLALVTEMNLAAGTQLTQIKGDESRYVWVRSGTIANANANGSVPPPAVGEGWEVAATSLDWQAHTDLQLYQLPSVHWEEATALAPQLFPAQLGDRTIADAQSIASVAATPVLDPGAAEPRLRAAVPVSKPRRSATPIVPLTRPPAPESGESGGASANGQVSPDPVIAFPKPRRLRHWGQRLWRRYPFIDQQSSSDCGAACLAMIGLYWGERFSLNWLRNLAGIGRSGASLKNLATAAEQIGFQARPVRASLSRLAEQTQPWIAHWEGDHYVVVYRIKGDRVWVGDPARGKLPLSRQKFLEGWTGYALLLDPTSQLKANNAADKASLGRFWNVIGTYQTTLWQIVLASLLIQVFGLISPLFTQVILDKVVTQKSLVTLHVFSLGLLLFGGWRIGLSTARQYLLDYFSNRINLTLVSGFITHALSLPLKFFESRQVGDIITRIQENQKVQSFLVRQVVSTWLDALMAIVYLMLMLYYNWQLTLLVLAIIPPIILLTLISTPVLRQISRAIFNEAAEQNSLLVEMLSGVATIKAAAAEREVRWRWEDRLTRMLNEQFKGQKLANGLGAISGLINTLGSTALLWYGATLVIQGQLTIGQFVAFNMMIGSVISPILSIVGLWDEFQEVLIAVERLNDVFATAPEESPGKPMLVLPPIKGEVIFDDVTFHYEQAEDRNTLQNLNLQLTAGQTAAIVGRSGSGKSTLVKLLQGLYYPTKGRIWIDGHDTRHVSPASLRSQLGVVPQECFLFSGTILENIQLYRPEFTLEQVVEVAKLAEAHAFIQDLPLGYNTKVGERGSNLSGGQRQRIAIARALLGDPAILILDEATSSLDTESERRFQQNLARISRGRTTFIIAHRLSTVRHADLILVLDRGILVEQGSHDDLIKLKGLYYHLAQQQLEL
jgi:ATP-binding cassette, subfamily B, bacterial HlyB/CyaB